MKKAFYIKKRKNQKEESEKQQCKEIKEFLKNFTGGEEIDSCRNLSAEIKTNG